MSSDNCVAILKTAGPEWRVAELGDSQIASMGWDHTTDTFSGELALQDARGMWPSQCFYDEDEACAAALDIWQNIDVCEYGITTYDFLSDSKF